METNDFAKRNWGIFVGSALHIIRVDLRLTQIDVAKRLSKMLGKNVTQSFVSKIENADEDQRKQISWARIGYYCEALGVEFELVKKYAMVEAMNSQMSDSDALTVLRKKTVKTLANSIN